MKQRTTLINARKKAGLTQSQLGELVGVSKQAISNWEAGRSGTRPETWDKLEDALNTPQRQLRKVTETTKV